MFHAVLSFDTLESHCPLKFRLLNFTKYAALSKPAKIIVYVLVCFKMSP